MRASYHFGKKTGPRQNAVLFFYLFYTPRKGNPLLPLTFYHIISNERADVIG